jgi:hypothetical protein
MRSLVFKCVATAMSLCVASAAYSATFTVSSGNVTALKNALNSVAPGDTIEIAAGTFNLSEGLKTVRDGAAGKYITIRGAGNSSTGTKLVLQQDAGYVLAILNDYYKVEGLFIDANAKGTKGVMIEGASHGYFTNVLVQKSLNECFKIRKNSKYWLLKNCKVQYSGQSPDQFGEGFYVSDADQNWKVVPETTGYITFLNCTAYKTKNDAFDLKEGSHHIKIIGCTIDFGNVETYSTRGANGIYNRSNYSQVIDTVYKNNMNCNDGGWFVLADNTTANGTSYGNNLEIIGCTQTNTYCEGAGKNDILVNNGFSKTTVYSDTKLTYTGAKPTVSSVTNFKEMQWTGEGGAILR